MKLIIPMVHNNSQVEQNPNFIKPLYEIQRKTIIEHVTQKLESITDVEFVFVIHHQDVITYHFDSTLRLLCPGCKIVVANGQTQGSACSCLLAIEEVNDNEPLLISGIDQYVDIDINRAIRYFQEQEYDAGAITFEDIHPRWSYLRLDENNLVIEAAEKNPISRNACVGFFYYRHASDFIDAAMKMIEKEAMTNGQYYVAPAFNEMILENKRIGIYKIDKKDYYSFMSEKGIDAFTKLLEKRHD